MRAACLTNANMSELLALFPDRSRGSIAAKRVLILDTIVHD